MGSYILEGDLGLLLGETNSIFIWLLTHETNPRGIS